MEKKMVMCLFLFVFLAFLFSSCHSRNISDIKPAMTKGNVIQPCPSRYDCIHFQRIISLIGPGHLNQ